MNFKELSKSPGYKNLKVAVLKDVEGKSCFNVMGCTESPCKCFHAYCSRFKKIIDRLKVIEHFGGDYILALDYAESKRNCWYMNYYNNSYSPLEKCIRILKQKAYLFSSDFQ